MRTLVLREMRETVRSRWLIGSAAAFALFAVTVACLGASGAGAHGPAGAGRWADLVLLLVPPIGLVMGALGLAGAREDGELGYLLTQPVSRAMVFFSKVLGRGLLLSLAIVVGLGLAEVADGGKGSPYAAAGRGALGEALLLGVSSLGIGFLVGTLAGGRTRALAGSLLAWAGVAFLADAGLAGGALAVGAVVPVGAAWLVFRRQSLR
ncbi:MAG: ABC transporter permease subunit [Planctomycetota bacterium]